MVPAGVDFEHQDSDRSICESEVSIISNRSSSGKPRVANVSKRPPQPEYIADPKQRLAAMGMDAFLKDMNQRSIAAFSKSKAASQTLSKDTEEAQRPTLETDTALFAGTFKQPSMLMGPGMEAGSLP